MPNPHVVGDFLASTQLAIGNMRAAAGVMAAPLGKIVLRSRLVWIAHAPQVGGALRVVATEHAEDTKGTKDITVLLSAAAG